MDFATEGFSVDTDASKARTVILAGGLRSLVDFGKWQTVEEVMKTLLLYMCFTIRVSFCGHVATKRRCLGLVHRGKKILVHGWNLIQTSVGGWT